MATGPTHLRARFARGALAPGLIERLALQPGHGVTTVTGTNGKTTTTHLLAAILRAGGVDPLTNPSGSNLERGLIAAYSGRFPR